MASQKILFSIFILISLTLVFQSSLAIPLQRIQVIQDGTYTIRYRLNRGLAYQFVKDRSPAVIGQLPVDVEGRAIGGNSGEENWEFSRVLDEQALSDGYRDTFMIRNTVSGLYLSYSTATPRASVTIDDSIILVKDINEARPWEVHYDPFTISRSIVGAVVRIPCFISVPRTATGSGLRLVAATTVGTSRAKENTVVFRDWWASDPRLRWVLEQAK
ncbi:hypothetical protein BGZ83_000485 [Gryganskiella cystojenkinii]|nr:hypothetical protein BGZ83_000485 [Gryganskiella cystojenkinii]